MKQNDLILITRSGITYPLLCGLPRRYNGSFMVRIDEPDFMLVQAESDPIAQVIITNRRENTCWSCHLDTSYRMDVIWWGAAECAPHAWYLIGKLQQAPEIAWMGP